MNFSYISILVQCKYIKEPHMCTTEHYHVFHEAEDRIFAKKIKNIPHKDKVFGHWHLCGDILTL